MSESTSRTGRTIAGSRSASPASARLAPAPDPSSSMAATLLLRRRHRSASMPSPEEMGELPPLARRYLTHEEFEAHYGADDADVDAVTRELSAHGLDVEWSHPIARTLRVSGTVGAFTALFGIEFVTFESQEGFSRACLDDVHLPAALVDRVEWIFGLDDRPVASPRGRYRSVSATNHLHHPLEVTQLVDLYEFPKRADGSGECVGIIELGGGYRRDDIEAYLAERGLAVPTIVDDGPNAPGGSDVVDMEVTMDVEIVAAAAPGARIVVYFASGNSIDRWYDVLSRAIHDTVNRPSVLSISWSSTEATGWTATEIEKLDVLFQEAALLGITVCACSGDSGTTYPNGLGPFSAPPTTEFPASDQYVLACGGTSITLAHGAPRGESVWNSLAETYIQTSDTKDGRTVTLLCNGGASGGGVSMYVPRPRYQADAGVPRRVSATFGPEGLGPPMLFEGRGVPDVAASAGLDTGYRIRYRGASVVGGGTSASAPLWAALIARLNQSLGCRLGFINPLFYHAQVGARGKLFRQVSGGSNGGYVVDPKAPWNPCTGLGTPRGRAIARALRNATATSTTSSGAT